MVQAELGPGYSLARMLARLQNNQLSQASSPVLQNASSTQSDGTPGLLVYQDPTHGNTQTIWYYGPGTSGASASNGLWPELLYIGQLEVGGSPAGSGVLTFRQDGSESMSIGTKGVGLIDKNGIVIWSESETSFGGIKTPYLFIGGGTNTNVSTWPSTTATTWTTIWTVIAPLWQPLINYNASAYAPTGVTANFRITVNGTSVVSWSASNNSFNGVASQASLPAGVSAGQVCTINLDAGISAGSGTVSATVYGLWGTANS